MNESYDQGGKPFAGNLKQRAINNNNYRIALWTGQHLQVTLMSIPVGQDVGLERHEGLDQMLTVASGRAVAKTGKSRENMSSVRLNVGDTVIIPDKTWHNVINTGCNPLKLISVYAPPQHPFGTVQPTRPEND